MAKNASKPGKQLNQEQRTKEKESLIKGLAAVMKEHGLTVRREKLRSGPGWKVVSGSCRVKDERLVFVDPRLSLEEQILFLVGRAKQSGISEEKLPKNTSGELNPVASDSASDSKQAA